MKQLTTISILSLFLGALAFPVYAHDTGEAHEEIIAQTTNTLRATTTSVNPRITDIKQRIEERKASATNRIKEVKTNIEERKASSTDRREVLKENIEVRKASSTERRVAWQKDIAKRAAENTARVLLATIERLENIALRLESRIAKALTESVDVAESKRYLDEAREHLRQARMGLTDLTSIDLTSDRAKDNFHSVRDGAANIKMHIREAHTSLMNAVRGLKPGQKERTATSTLKIEN